MPDPHPAAIAITPDVEEPDPVLGPEELRERGLKECLGSEQGVLEFGFGRAEALIELARAAPDRWFLGIEVSRKRVEKAARRVVKSGVRNLRLMHAPAEYVLERVLPEGCITECWINFSDPWPKKRHHRRRLIRLEIVRELVRVLAPGARLHMATDHAGYADWIREVMAGVPGLRNLNAPAPWSDRRPARLETRYEAEFRAEGRSIAYFEYQKRSGSP